MIQDLQVSTHLRSFSSQGEAAINNGITTDKALELTNRLLNASVELGKKRIEVLNKKGGFTIKKNDKSEIEIVNISPKQFNSLDVYKKSKVLAWGHDMADIKSTLKLDDIRNDANEGINLQSNDFVGNTEAPLAWLLYNSGIPLIADGGMALMTNVRSLGRKRNYLQNNTAPFGKVTSEAIYNSTPHTIIEKYLRVYYQEKNDFIDPLEFLGWYYETSLNPNINEAGYTLPQVFEAAFYANWMGWFGTWFGSAIYYSSLSFNLDYVPAGLPVNTPAAMNFPTSVKPEQNPALNSTQTAGFQVSEMKWWSGLVEQIINEATLNADGTFKDPFGRPTLLPYVGAWSATNALVIMNSFIAVIQKSWYNSDNISFRLSKNAYESLQQSYIQPNNFNGFSQTSEGAGIFRGHSVVYDPHLEGDDSFLIYSSKDIGGDNSSPFASALSTINADGKGVIRATPRADNKDGLVYKMRFGYGQIIQNGTFIIFYTNRNLNPLYPLINNIVQKTTPYSNQFSQPIV